MNTRLLSLLLSALLAAAACAESPYPLCCDIDAAYDYCRQAPLQSPEGVWRYPEDNVTVLIRRAITDDGNVAAPTFDIIVVETPDCLLQPGERLGTLTRLADKRQFQLTLFTRRKGLNLISPASCLATLAPDGSALAVKKPKIKFSFNPLSILPRFWRTIKLRVDDPLRDSPAGMIRIFPNDDGTPPHPEVPLYF